MAYCSRLLLCHGDLLLLLLLQPWVQVTAVNPQRCVPYFSISLPIYDGDTYHSITDRLRRSSGIPGQWSASSPPPPPLDFSLSSDPTIPHSSISPLFPPSRQSCCLPPALRRSKPPGNPGHGRPEWHRCHCPLHTLQRHQQRGPLQRWRRPVISPWLSLPLHRSTVVAKQTVWEIREDRTIHLCIL